MNPTTENSTHVGFFVIAEAHRPDLEALSEQATHAVRAWQDDMLVQANDLYRRAATACIHRAVMSGHGIVDVYIAVTKFLCKGMQWDRDQDVFSTEQTRAMAGQLRAWETRLGGEDSIVARIGKRERHCAPDDIRALYRALKDVLAAAAERGAGLVMATLRDDAEEQLATRRAEAARELAEDRAFFERRQAGIPLEEHEKLPWHVDSDNPAVRQAALDAWVEQNNAKHAMPEPAINPKRLAHAPQHIMLIPVSRAAAVHKLMRQRDRHVAQHDDYLAGLTMLNRIRQRAQPLASNTYLLPREGELIAVSAIRMLLPNTPIRDDYTLKQTRRMRQAMETWHADRGMGPMLNDILRFIAAVHSGPIERFRPLAAHTVHVVRQALDQAVDSRCSTFWWS